MIRIIDKYTLMIEFTMDMNIHMYVAILLDYQPQKINKKQKRKIPQSLIQDAQEIS